MNWFATVRRDFVGKYARKHGSISRPVIAKYFGVSLAQASGDIQEFLSSQPGYLEYDLRKKIYRWKGDQTGLPPELVLPRPHWNDLIECKKVH